ncbi:MAG TPA: PadR family transcriptional regulator [Acidobacteriota bacterium]|nr:PadR family transcriptional regulator [Acidobacteriota bacterium]
MATHNLTRTNYYILLALSDRGRHGLGIAAEVERFTDGEIVLGPGLLYGSIKRLAEEGLIEEAEAGGCGGADPRRRYYQLSAAGRAALQAEVSLQSRILAEARAKKAAGESS